MCQQIGHCLAVAQLRRFKLLVLALWRMAYTFSILALLGLVVLCITLTGLGTPFLLFLELTLLFLNLCGVGALELHAHRVKSFLAVQLHDVEEVDDYLRLGKLLPHDTHHAVREVHRHLFDLLALLLWYPVKMLRHIGNSRTFDSGYERTPLAVAVLVGEDSEQVVVQHRLVDTQALTHVLLLQHPLVGMFLLLPVVKAAQVLLVGTAKVLAVSPEEAPHALGRHRVGIQPFFLRNPRTPRSSWFPLPPAAGSQE